VAPLTLSIYFLNVIEGDCRLTHIIFSRYKLPVIKVIFAQLLSVIVTKIGLTAPIYCMYIVLGATWWLQIYRIIS